MDEQVSALVYLSTSSHFAQNNVLVTGGEDSKVTVWPLGGQPQGQDQDMET
jgi:hypothetical protein